jgi:hypothetical protein
MYSLLLRKALPFALTFVIGSLVGGLFKAVGIGGGGDSNARSYFYRHGGRHGCGARAGQRYLVAESKPLQITFKPDARLPQGIKRNGLESLSARVTFGADGKVQNVEHVSPEPGTCQMKWMESVTRKWEAVQTAARQIQFEPETVDGVPVTVTREVEIHFMDAD